MSRMRTVSYTHLDVYKRQHQLNASTELMAFGQELNDQTFAICKADMLIKGNNADFIKDGNTLSDDQFEGQTFDYVLSNPCLLYTSVSGRGSCWP